MATYDINNRPSRLGYGDEINFQVEEKAYKTHVTRYRISSLSGGMDYDPLEAIGLKSREERMEFATAAYGYEANGACFPECRRDDYPALTRLANAIFDRIQNSDVETETTPVNTFKVGDPVKLKMKGVDGETLMATIRREIVSKVELDRRWIVTDTDESPERNIEVATMDEDGGEDGEHVGWFSASELELVEAAEVRPFKAKDRVKVVSDRLGNRMGKLGTVEYDDRAESVPFRVQMDEDGEPIWFDAHELELVQAEPKAAEEPTAEPEAHTVKIGDKVRVKAEVKDPKYDWGPVVVHGYVGVVSGITEDKLYVDFPSHTGWMADPAEMELVTDAEPEPISFDAALAVVLNGIPETFRACVGDLVMRLPKCRTLIYGMSSKDGASFDETGGGISLGYSSDKTENVPEALDAIALARLLSINVERAM